MVGDAALREVVGADLRRTVAGADLGQTHRAFLLLALAHLPFEEAAPQDPHRLLLVLELALLVLARNDEAGGLVRDPDRRIRRVYALTTRRTRTVNIDLKVILRDLDFHLFGLRQHGYCYRRGVDTALALGFGYSLDPVSTALVFEHRVGPVAVDLDYDLFIAPDLGRVRVEGAVLEAEAVGIAGIHLVELAGEEGGLVATSAGPYLDDDVLIIVRVAVYELGPDLLGQLLDLLLGHLSFFRKELTLFGGFGRRDQLPRLPGLLNGIQ